ncbi:lytic transglycosylase domain-containing protein [Agrobacterium rhizogenes]|nr:lytic transglycosylase domain-containing protein [Rhizobium rhizogenes]
MAQETTPVLSLYVDGETPPDEIKQMIIDKTSRQQASTKRALAVASEESGFRARVNSNAGARGPMQLMPATAVRYGVAEICDARENILGGVSYLKELMATFGGNVMLAVAAYNARENRIIATRGITAWRRRAQDSCSTILSTKSSGLLRSDRHTFYLYPPRSPSWWWRARSLSFAQGAGRQFEFPARRLVRDIMARPDVQS